MSEARCKDCNQDHPTEAWTVTPMRPGVPYVVPVIHCPTTGRLIIISEETS